MKKESHGPLDAAQHRYLLACLFLAGAATLVLELVGARLISPYYGSSLYSWSAVITVTLVALAAGYSFGGQKADGAPSLILFSRLLSTAGLAVALIPSLRAPILKSTASLGVQLGALSSATILIAPALITLSALGPLAIRLLATAMATVGSSAGNAYALSTLGSVFGAALAGFALIPHLPLSRILYGTAVVLLLLGALGAYLSTRRVPIKELSAAAAAGLTCFWPKTQARTNMLMNAESPYAQIKILDFDRKRYLMVNGTSQSVARLDDYESDSPYIHALELAALMRPKASRALVIGLGAGLIPSALERVYGIVTDSVDVDPAVVSAARRFFRFSPRGDVTTEDGRTYLARTERRYGLIVLDAFASESPPYHLFTAEAFDVLRRAMVPGGVLAVNLVSLLHHPGDEAWLAAYKTLHAVFPEVRAYSPSPPYEDLANVLFFCSDAPLEMPALAAARPLIKDDLEYLLAHELRPSEADLARARLLTDDHAPLEFLLARTTLVWRKSLQDTVGSVMLH